MNATEKELRSYYRRIRALLPCPRRMKRSVLDQVRDRAAQLQAEHPEAAAWELKASLGAPEQIAAAYVESMGTAELLKSLCVRRRILRLAILVAAVIVVTWSALVIGAAIDARNSIHGSEFHYIEIISRETDPPTTTSPCIIPSGT